MTTSAHPAPERYRRTPQVLPVVAAWVTGAVLVVSLLAALLEGSYGWWGAAFGGLVALGFFLFGSVVVDVASRVTPQLAMMVALITYAFQVVAVAAVFLGVWNSGEVGESVSAEWIAGGVMVATAAWVVSQIVVSTRARVPAYDVELPGEGAGVSPTDGSEPTAVAAGRSEAGAA